LDDYLANKIDWCLMWKQVELLNHRPEETYLVQYLGTFFLEFSCNFWPFNHKLVRQAFARTINQAELVREVWANGQRVASGGVVPPGMPGHSPEIGLGFDPVAARALLKHAGFNSGLDLPPLTLVASPGFGATSTFLQSSWQEHLGAQVQIIEGVSIEEISAMMKQGIAQLSLSNWDVDYPDPDDIMRVLFHSASPNNYLGWQNQQFDQYVEQAARLTDYTTRLALYHQADRILVAEDTAIVPLYYRQGYGLLKPSFAWQGAGRVIRGGTFKLKNIRVI
jgi:ABC-type oligopeptide transport system substrate-binding subunit